MNWVVLVRSDLTIFLSSGFLKISVRECQLMEINLHLSETHFCELTLESLSEMETLEDVTDLAKRYAVSHYYLSEILALVE